MEALVYRTPRAQLRVSFLLVFLYLASVACHLFLFRDVVRFPHISSDEVQYAMAGENLRLGHGFVLRGQFNSTTPPIFAVFVALAHSLASNPRMSMFILSTFAMCAALFPVFGIARSVGLETKTSAILAFAASLIPHTFYVATYMAEVVQYPAYLTTIFIAIRWLDVRTWIKDLSLGIGIGFLLLTKVQGSQFLAGFVIAIAAICIYEWKASGRFPQALVAHFSVVLLTTATIQASWNLYKALHGGTALGLYGTVLAENALPHWSASLTIAYLADFLLAPGLITAVLLFYWLRRNGNYPRTVFLAAIFAVQVIAVSTLDGGLTGWLRERLYIYELPVTTVLAARGLLYLREDRNAIASLALLVAPIALVGLLSLYPFHVSSVIEVPWAHALGSAGVIPFSRLWLALCTAAISLIISLILLKCPYSRAAMTFAIYIVAFNVVPLVTSTMGLKDWTVVGLRRVDSIMTWLSAHHVRVGDRLLIAGRHGFFESPAVRTAPQDPEFLDWNWRLGLSEVLEWQIETIGRFEVRMIPSLAALRSEARPGDYFLTTATVQAPGLDLKGVQFPLRLYQVLDTIIVDTGPRYVTDIPADQFYTIVGRRDAGQIRGSGSEASGYLVYGPYQAFNSGTYRVGFHIQGSESEAIFMDVADQQGQVYGTQSSSTGKAAMIEFALSSPADLQFRVVGKSRSDFYFKGVTIERTDAQVPVVAPRISAPASLAMLSDAEPSGLHGHRSAPGGACYVDLVNDITPAATISVDRTSGLHLLGWAAEPEKGVAPQHVYLELSEPTGRTFWVRGHRSLRPDVAQAFAKPGLAEAGFSLSADARHLPVGSYRMKMVLLDGSHAKECDLNRYVELR